MAGLYTSFASQLKLDEIRNEYRHYCSNCGHTVRIYPMEHVDKKLCNWCGYYVYVKQEEQDKYDFKRKLRLAMGGK